MIRLRFMIRNQYIESQLLFHYPHETSTKFSSKYEYL